MSSPTSSTHAEETAAADLKLRADLATAAERRARERPNHESNAQSAEERTLRLNFRRAIDPGIVRPNSEEKAEVAIKILLTLSSNLLREPDNPKFSQFKTTNSVIKRDLVEIKGALEYAVLLGFRAEVSDFQPLYIFNKRKTTDLQIGNAILKEHMERITVNTERTARSVAAQKAVRDTAARNALLAFEDDRKTKALHDQREKERQAARAAAAAAVAATNPGPPASPPGAFSAVAMPGGGISLAGQVYPASAAADPPPYQDDGEDDEED